MAVSLKVRHTGTFGVQAIASRCERIGARLGVAQASVRVRLEDLDTEPLTRSGHVLVSSPDRLSAEQDQIKTPIVVFVRQP